MKYNIVARSTEQQQIVQTISLHKRAVGFCSALSVAVIFFCKGNPSYDIVINWNLIVQSSRTLILQDKA